ncbi:carbamoyltransferase family protein [Alteromonas sp. ASW11-130]|uniref:carbamoyltransferase family protein n=1 Tax=Alteromonas sp. ASW11-130 TaxID=3015775 RepID=UPI0022422BB0|nr:carbamoyltransferase [Alteromonas sp. ASW11-130]MCW8092497.1 carbamoyltransferase [Alteromonas sp. ASW11-130]
MNDTSVLQKKEDRVVIGMSFGYHDSSCCVIKNGEVLAAVHEERFSRVKNDKSFPRQSLRYCLGYADVSIDEVDCIAYYEDAQKKLARQIWMGTIDDADPFRRKEVYRHICEQKPEDTIRDITGYSGHIEISEHHLSHAASAYYFSGFDDAAVLTVDGVGEWATTSYSRAEGNGLSIFEEVNFPDSIGLLYSTITSFLGFKVNSGEYKVMGLAPYGRPVYKDKILSLIELKEKGQYSLNMDYFDFLNTNRMYSDKLIELMGIEPRKPESELDQIHMDVAKSLQVALEEILLEKVNYLYDQVPSDNLCMAGGVALNCVANGRILREGPYKNLFVQPASGDAGTALGAAAIAWVGLFGERPKQKDTPHAYLGTEASSDEIHNLLMNSGVKFSDYRGNEEELAKFVASRIAEGAVIGWFQGRMEFGPRALGARSILADPRLGNMRDKINSLVKMREAFRPFAPAVMAEKASEHFALTAPSPFMLQTCDVESLIDLPAITHVDNSARVQTVSKEANPRFHRLLSEFDAITDCPIILNTSFNVRGEPVVRTPLDAVTCFVRASIDYLVLGDFIISQADIPEMWKVGVSNTPIKKDKDPRAIGHAVYTFL